jgi:hypothetical protein
MCLRSRYYYFGVDGLRNYLVTSWEIFRLRNYVPTKSGQDDKRGRGSVPLRRRKDEVRSYLEWEWGGVFEISLLLQERDSSVPSRMTNLLLTAVPTITVTYPDLRSQIPRYALNDDVAGWNEGHLYGEELHALDPSLCSWMTKGVPPYGGKNDMVEVI